MKVPPQGWPDEDYEICYKGKGRSGKLTLASLRLEKHSMTVVSREKEPIKVWSVVFVCIARV